MSYKHIEIRQDKVFVQWLIEPKDIPDLMAELQHYYDHVSYPVGTEVTVPFTFMDRTVKLTGVVSTVASPVLRHVRIADDTVLSVPISMLTKVDSPPPKPTATFSWR